MLLRTFIPVKQAFTYSAGKAEDRQSGGTMPQLQARPVALHGVPGPAQQRNAGAPLQALNGQQYEPQWKPEWQQAGSGSHAVPHR